MFPSKSLQRLLALLLILLSLGGCAASPATPESLVQAMMQAEKPLPAGRLYVLSAPSDNAKTPTEELLAVTFGNGTLPPELSQVTDAAFFLSYTQPCEFAVFLCTNRAATEAVARMCLRRVDTVLRAQGEVDQEIAAHAVTVRGRWVILCLSSDPQSALRAFRQGL